MADDCGPLTYGLEIERRDMNLERWVLEPALGQARLSGTTYQFDWSENTWGRYRIWATDANGQRSSKTTWRYFTFATADVPQSERFRQPLP